MILKVAGMYCSWCQERIKNCINNFRGIIRIKTDLKKHEVEVISIRRLNKNQVAKEISSAGYGPVK